MPRANYGQDAPGVVRNLSLVGAAGLMLGGSTAAGWWSGTFSFTIGSARILFPIGHSGFWWGSGFAAMALWMVYSSRFGKMKERDRLLHRITWTGRERVLDVGCGRGLMLIGAAKRLTTGKAIGVDIWQSEDLSGNRPEATLANAQVEGVADRVEIKTADMRKLPFESGTIDVVVSMAAIHNLYKKEERQAAISEIARVLRPGGHALIDDIRHGDEYAAGFEAGGCRVIAREGAIDRTIWTVITMGSIRPAVLVVEKR
jgi:SAM-dependent methyltransferase